MGSADLRRGLALTLLLGLLGSCGSGGGFTPVQTAFNKGVHHLAEGHLDAAIHAFREAVREDPDDLAARFNLALALEALARNPDLPAELAAVHDQEAAAQYQAILDRRPTHLRAQVHLAVRAFEAGDRAAAAAHLSAAEAAHPDSPRPAAVRAHFALREGRMEEALSGLEAAHGRDPGDPEILGLLAEAALKVDDAERAAAAAERLLSIDPDDVGALLVLARLHLAQGDFRAARAAAQRAVLANPFVARAHLVLSDAEEALGAHAAAWHHWREARRLVATHPDPWNPSAVPEDPARERRLLEALLRDLPPEPSR